MTELVTVTCGGDNIVREIVRLTAGDARTDAIERPLLGVVHDLIDFFEIVGRLTEIHRAREVGGVSINDCANVNHHWLVRADDALRGNAVRERGAFTRRNNRTGYFASAASHALFIFETRGGLVFNHAGFEPTAECVEYAIRDIDGALDELDFALVFDGAQLFHRVAQT